MWRIIAVLALAQIGAGAIFDLGDYIMSTGNYPITGDTDRGMAFLKTINGSGTAIILEQKYVDQIPRTKEAGYVNVTKPYPGWFKVEEGGKIGYIGEIDSGIFISIHIPADDAQGLLSQILVSSHANYQAEMGAKLQEVLA